MSFDAGQRVHVLGIGGAGMSALAVLLAERGCVVSGCDGTHSPTLAALAERGVTVFVGHDPRHVSDVDLVTASPALPADHDELREARRRGVRVLDRAEVLATLAAQRSVLAIAGTHGKTTTSSMLAHVLRAAGRDPGWLIGADLVSVGPGGHWGTGELVLEADESYGTFRALAPAALAITNVEADHLDYYGDLARLEAAFAALVERTDGPIVVWSDDDGARRVAGPRSVSVGRDHHADVRVSDEQLARDGATFRLTSPWATCEVTLAVTSPMNVANAAVAGALALSVGVEPTAVVAGLGAFPGAPRRFQTVGAARGTAVIVDYAHLPGEVAGAVAAARASGYRRVGAIFQPHRVTRTERLAPAFAASFDGLASLIVTDIYTAGEANPAGLSGRLVVDAVRGHVGAPPVDYAATLAEAATRAAGWLGEFDAVLVLGAGDVVTVGDTLVGA